VWQSQWEGFRVDRPPPREPKPMAPHHGRRPLHASLLRRAHVGGGGSPPPPPPFRPLDIAGLTLWLQADTLTLAANEPVLVWPDLSGNGHDATAPPGPGTSVTPVFQPNAIAGRSTLHFNGNQFLEIAGPITSRTLFVVVTHEDGAVFTDFRRVLDGNDVDGYSLFGYVGQSLYNPTSSYPRNFNPARFWINGVLTTDAAPLAHVKVISGVMETTITTPGLWLGTLMYGAFQSLLGTIAEVALYDRPLTDAERLQVEAYLMTRYGITSP
jgi:hypothetical protein